MGKIIPVFIIYLSIISNSCTEQEHNRISYNRDIRPIFNQKCIACHGGVKKNGGFSLLFEAEAFDTTTSGKYAIVPGAPDQSELFRRISTTDMQERMPPEGPALKEREIQLIRRWIKQGAQWEDHWAFVAPDKHIKPPEMDLDQWGKNDIDRFVYQRLLEKDLEPAPEASPAVLLRRVFLDLIGLPPTPEESEIFLADPSYLNFRNIVDTLLASPHYGERWASMWLDLARYGDSQGYQKDPLRRNIWRYRDWVIHALNNNMPFDQFTIEQLAGDLLPDPTDAQVLATAFHRNTNTNDEGGTDDEEFRVVAVIDRLNTTFEVWQGITMSCVQCHSHPYDPIRHEEFYELIAFFNNTSDADQPSEFPKRNLFSPAQLEAREELLYSLGLIRQEGDTLSDVFIKKVKTLQGIKKGEVPIMEELPPEQSRTTHIFERGNWLVHGKEVTPGVPDSWPPISELAEPDRLTLAQWLVDSENPLAGRVIVNRFWEQLFGRGIVETSEDFGSQGSPPSHPALLDWLAVRFVHHHEWDIKALLREMVLSATYRQSSEVDPLKWDIDPYNSLLSRGPRVRLSAEQIRDQALAVSGLLSRKMYGPSVMPPQPEGVWNVIRQVARWETSEGEDRYRRGVYTLWRKTSPYPSMVTFDAPSRELCVSRRIRTNTPLQAMITLNDPVYMEAARALAATMDSLDDLSVNDRLKMAYSKAMVRQPDDFRLKTLSEYFGKIQTHYQINPEELEALLPADSLRSPERAAWINTANLILNLDEFIMKN